MTGNASVLLLDYSRRVFTNPGCFDDNGCLTITGYQRQESCKHSTCTSNMCKGNILEGYIRERAGQGVVFDRISYCGDGSNDVCPSLRLASPRDIAFPRKGFTFHKILTNKKDLADQMIARVCVWTTGQDILDALRGEAENGELTVICEPQPASELVHTPPTPPPSPDDEK